MLITIAVTVCHLVSAAPAAQPHGPHDRLDIHRPPNQIEDASGITVCHEEIAFQGDGSMQACLAAMPAAADWKMRSFYADDGWSISKVRCVPGKIEPRGSI